MIVRVPDRSRWRRSTLAVALLGLAYASCTTSEDTEPYVPAEEGAIQPGGDGALLDEDEACERVKSAAEDAYGRLRCDAPTFAACPGFIRPGAGNGCYAYYEESVEACEEAYADAGSCQRLSPCIVSAVLDETLPSCVLGAGGAGGGGAGGGGAGGGGAGGAGPGGAGSGGDAPAGGAPSMGGTGAEGGVPAGGVGGAG
jgi:hypothetical protein